MNGKDSFSHPRERLGNSPTPWIRPASSRNSPHRSRDANAEESEGRKPDGCIPGPNGAHGDSEGCREAPWKETRKYHPRRNAAHGATHHHTVVPVGEESPPLAPPVSLGLDGMCHGDILRGWEKKLCGVRKSMKVILYLFLISWPLNGAEVQAVVERFYANRALDVRGSVEEEDIRDFLPLLTPSLRASIANAQRTVEAWRTAAKVHPDFFKDLKPPPDEGPLFTGVYEGGEFTKIVSVQSSAERAYVTVSLNGKPLFPKHTWTDIVILHRIDSAWLIDDILSGSESGQPDSIRIGLKYPEPPKPTL